VSARETEIALHYFSFLIKSKITIVTISLSSFFYLIVRIGSNPYLSSFKAKMDYAPAWALVHIPLREFRNFPLFIPPIAAYKYCKPTLEMQHWPEFIFSRSILPFAACKAAPCSGHVHKVGLPQPQPIDILPHNINNQKESFYVDARRGHDDEGCRHDDGHDDGQ
jgi:hypothetical protein